jgi:hypothetical protein
VSGESWYLSVIVTSSENSSLSGANIRLGPCTNTSPIIEKKKMAIKARARFIVLQFSGSRDERVGMGNLSKRPSDEMRNTLPEKSRDSYLERVDVEVEALYSLGIGDGDAISSSCMLRDAERLLWVRGESWMQAPLVRWDIAHASSGLTEEL